MLSKSGSKLHLFFVILILVLAATGLMTILYTYKLQQQAAELQSALLARLNAAHDLQVVLFKMQSLTLNYSLDRNVKWLDELEQHKDKFNGILTKAKAASTSRHEGDALRAVVQSFSEYEQDLRTALDLSDRGRQAAAQRILFRASRERFEVINANCQAFMELIEDNRQRTDTEIERTSQVVLMAMYGLGIGGLILGGILGIVLSRNLRKPIYELVLKVRGAAGGDYVERLDVAQGQELQALDRHVERLIERINATTADLEHNRRLLARSEKLAALGIVAASVAHEIRNPLTAIKTLIFGMKEELATSDEKSEDLAVVLKEIDRMEKFIQNFLQFARPPSLATKLVEINEIIKDTVLLVRPRLQQNNTELIEKYGKEGGALLADPDQLRQVMLNLINNAVEAMPHGGQLTIETFCEPDKSSSPSPSWIKIRFKDTGTGIAAELSDNMFDPFVSDKKNGVGLGLSIAYQIAQNHHGWIDAINNPEGGATFTVSLPAG